MKYPIELVEFTQLKKKGVSVMEPPSYYTPKDIFSVMLGGNKENAALFKPKPLTRYPLPQLYLAPSLLPKAGMGVFTAEKIKRGAPITVYGGEIITEAQAQELRRNNEHTHFQTLVRTSEHIDGRINDDKGYTYEYYLRNHYLGSFLNDPTKGTARLRKQLVNTNYEKFEPHPLIGPYDYTETVAHPEGQQSMSMIVLVANRDIEPDVELYAWYGPAYWRDFPIESKVCQLCSNTMKGMCDRCNAVSYCSQACQRRDWPIHSKVCSKV